MEKNWSGQPDYLDAYIRTAQYLSGMKTQQDIWAETGKVLVSFFDADVGAVATVSQDGAIIGNHRTFSDRFTGRRDLEDAAGGGIAEVVETGFLTLRVIPTPAPLSLAFLPIMQENRVVAVMLAGHRSSGSLPKELLNIYLAVAGLVSTTAERLAAERELRRHRHHLEQLVGERTAELTRSNELLQQEISERRLAEEALRYERDNLVSIFEAMEDDIYIVDGEGYIQYGNSALEKDFGPYAGRRCFEYLNNSEEPCSFCHLGEVLAGRTVRWERSFSRSEKIFDIIETPLKHSKGVSKLTIFRDITDRKRAEEELHRANRELRREVEARKTAEEASIRAFSLCRATFESTTDGILVVDREGRIVDYNDRFKELWGIPDDVMRSMNDDRALTYVLDQIINPDEFVAKVRELYNKPEEESLDILRFRDGRIYERYSLPQRLADQVTGRVWSFRDITEQKHAEDALRESRELLNAIVEGTSDAVFAKDTEGRFILVNSAVCRNTGKSAEEVLGRDVTVLFSEQEAWVCMEMDRSLLTEPRTVTFEESFVFNGERKVFLTTKGTLSDKNGIASGIFGISRDITELKRLEAERLEMERRLLHSQKLESLGVLAGGIAHDFNNLLAVILGNLDMTLLKLPLNTPVQQNIDDAVRACQRAVKLIRQMLDYAGKGLFVLSDIELNDIVRENAALFRTSVGRNIELAVVTTPGLPGIKADQDQIQQVIMNLIINAAEAIGESPGIITIRTGLLDCDDAYLSRSRVEEKPHCGTFVYLEVSDTGCGMDEQTQARLFEPFFTTKFMGRGLGMSAVQGIVREHGGAIILESEAGKGSLFRVLFSVAGEVREQTPETAAPAELRELPVPCNGTILVVDDEEEVRHLCMEIVEYLGFQAIGAADGSEALNIFSGHAEEINLVILDMTMPVMDGVTTFHAMRRIGPGVDVILSSGYSEENIAGRFADAGPSGFIQKPFKVEDLRDKIFKVMRLRSASDGERTQ